jgi:hypothetical protein
MNKQFAAERVREYIESLGMSGGIDPTFVRELARELDHTRRQLIEARAAMYRIGAEVDLVMSNDSGQPRLTETKKEV